MVSGIGGSSTTASLSSASGIEQLVQQATALQQQNVAAYETRIDDLEVKKGVYSDIQSKLEALQSAVEALRGDDGTGGVLNTFSTSVTGDDILTASVTDSESTGAGTYDIAVSQLASVDRYASYQFADPDSPSVSGTITLVGAADRSVSGESYGADPADETEIQAVSDFDVSTSIRDGETELASGNYYVEVAENGGIWQFRIVDSSGAAVSVDDAAKSDDSMTDGWQNITEVAGRTFNTGRGLTISFENLDDADDYVAGTKDDGNAASVNYTTSGSDITITIDATDSLSDIRDKINDEAYLDEKAVEVTIVDDRLILSSVNSGSDSALDGGAVTFTGGLDVSLGWFAADTDGNGQLEDAQDAMFTVNGLDITRSSNSIDDVIPGVTLTLTDETDEDASTTRLTVKRDNSDITSKVKSLLTAFNEAVSHIKLKTSPQLDEDADTENPTYTAAPLGTDYSMKELRYGLTNDLLTSFSGASNTAFDNLFDIGIDVNEDDNVSFEISDLSAFNSALDDNFSDVAALLEDVLSNLNDRLENYIEDDTSILPSTQDGIDLQIDGLEDRRDSAQERLSQLEEMYREQYYEMQAQLLTMQYEYQNTMSIFNSSNSLYNLQI